MENEDLALKADLEIYTFGDFDVKYKGNSIIYKFNNSPQIFNLFMFFIAHRHRVLSAEFIEENLWEDKEYQDSKNVIKGQIFRLRKIIRQISLEECNGELEEYIEIKFKSGGYTLILKGDYFIDNEEFQENIKIIKRFEESQIIDLERNIHTLDLYKNHFISNLSYNHWILPIRNYYKRLYIDLVECTIKLLKKIDNDKMILSILEYSILIEPFEESFHFEFIHILLKQNKYKEALEHYKYFKDRLEKQLDIMPSQFMEDLYNIICESFKSKDVIESLREPLEGEIEILESRKRCDKNTFERNLKLAKEQRTINEINSSLVKVSLDKSIGKNYNRVLQSLIKSIDISIRKSDIYYLDKNTIKDEIYVLLCCIREEDWDMLKNRILNNFIKCSKKEYIRYLNMNFTVI